MSIREMIGEVSGKNLIDIGDIVIVSYGTKECLGRLNKASEKEIEVGNKTIKIRDIIKIKKLK